MTKQSFTTYLYVTTGEISKLCFRNIFLMYGNVVLVIRFLKKTCRNIVIYVIYLRLFDKRELVYLCGEKNRDEADIA